MRWFNNACTTLLIRCGLISTFELITIINHEIDEHSGGINTEILHVFSLIDDNKLILLKMMDDT